MLSTAPALFIGLGARVLIDTLSRSTNTSPIPPPPPSIPDFILLGAWQGVGLYYALMEQPVLAIAVAFAIGAKLFFEFMIVPDIVKCAVTLLGVVLGVMFTDVLSQVLEDGGFTQFGSRKASNNNNTSSSKYQRQRTVSFSRKDPNASSSRRDRDRKVSHSDITAPSLDSTLDWIDRTSPTPLDREVATLRARASLADTEKRRYKEERVWALAQGNQARAEQMAWQVKRYRALVHGFHKEADKKLLEGEYHPRDGYSVSALFNGRFFMYSQRETAPCPPPHPALNPFLSHPLSHHLLAFAQAFLNLQRLQIDITSAQAVVTTQRWTRWPRQAV